MTISSSTKRVQITSGSELTVTDLEAQDSSQFLVVHTTAAGVDSTYVLDTDYTVSADLSTITLTSALAASEKATATLTIAATQATDYQINGALNANTIEDALDKLTLKMKELDEILARCVKLPEVNASVNTDIDNSTVAADRYIKFDATATGIEASDLANVSTIELPVPVASGGTGATTAAAARAALGTTISNESSPTLAADLDADGNNIVLNDNTGLADSAGNLVVTVTGAGGSPVNRLNVTNSETGNQVITAPTGSDTNIDLLVDSKGTGDVNLGTADTANVTSTGTNVVASAGTLHRVNIGGLTKADITSSGLQLGGANATVTTILDEDTMSSDSATALATQQSIKAYVDASQGWVHLATATAATSSELAFTSAIDSTYDAYVFVATSISPASSDTALKFQTSTNGGSSYDSTANDYFWAFRSISSGTDGDTSSETDDEVVWINGIGTAAGHEGNGVLFMYNPAGTDFTHFHGDSSTTRSSGDIERHSLVAARQAAADVDAIRFYMSSGNIATGSIRMYGIVKS